MLHLASHEASHSGNARIICFYGHCEALLFPPEGTTRLLPEKPSRAGRRTSREKFPPRSAPSTRGRVGAQATPPPPPPNSSPARPRGLRAPAPALHRATSALFLCDRPRLRSSARDMIESPVRRLYIDFKWYGRGQKCTKSPTVDSRIGRSGSRWRNVSYCQYVGTILGYESKIRCPSRARKKCAAFPPRGRHARAPKGRLACLMLMFVRL